MSLLAFTRLFPRHAKPKASRFQLAPLRSGRGVVDKIKMPYLAVINCLRHPLLVIHILFIT